MNPSAVAAPSTSSTPGSRLSLPRSRPYGSPPGDTSSGHARSGDAQAGFDRLRELELVTRTQAGDRRALDELLRMHRPRIEKLCRRMCRGDESFDDVLQETYLGILRNIASFRGDSAFLTWVFTVARTYRGRYVRTANRTQTHETTGKAEETTDGDLDIESSVAGYELGGAIERALGSLSELDRRILLLRDVEGRTAAEVAAALGLSIPAVKTRLHRARVTARRELGSLYVLYGGAARPLRVLAARAATRAFALAARR